MTMTFQRTQQGGRTVTIGGSRNLNERFGQLASSSKKVTPVPSGCKAAGGLAGHSVPPRPASVQKQQQKPTQVSKSVFARIQSPKKAAPAPPAPASKATVTKGGIKKQGKFAQQRALAAGAARGIQKQLKQTQSTKQQQPQKQQKQLKQQQQQHASKKAIKGNQNVSKKQNDKKKSGGGALGKNKKPKDKPKPMTAESLDAQLDKYMFKDPKSAQARLDEELSSYMADAPAHDDFDL
ncbi:hypothetical protein BC940DRAFT_306567 [Gongronella butleri]|nr:hypothetical protein BC940DRAFT_306567 [Gongronella butleri]